MFSASSQRALFRRSDIDQPTISIARPQMLGFPPVNDAWRDPEGLGSAIRTRGHAQRRARSAIGPTRVPQSSDHQLAA